MTRLWAFLVSSLCAMQNREAMPQTWAAFLFAIHSMACQQPLLL